MNCENLLVKYYDPLKINKYLKEILKSLFKFLNIQKSLAGKELMKTNFKDLAYQKTVVSESFCQEDSAIFMLKQVYNISLEVEEIVNKNDFNEYRLQFLKLLFQYGIKFY